MFWEKRAAALIATLIVGLAALGGCKRGSVPAVNVAEAQASSDITPRAEVSEVARHLSQAFATAAEVIRPSVVRVDVESSRNGSSLTQGPGQAVPPGLEEFFHRFFGSPGRGLPPPVPQRGTGSGVVIDAEGHVLTNSHVVEGAEKVTIQLVDGRKFEGRVVGRDPLTDLAVIRFVDKPDDLAIARLGQSETLRVGEWVLAVGSPLGLAQTVTAGIVSGMESGRNLPAVSGQRVQQYIQTDAAINPGNSGGPLVNLAGEVVGLTTFINVGPGGSYGYAIAIAQAGAISQTIIKEGRVRYPYIGVQIADVDSVPPEVRGGAKLPEEGAFIAEVTPAGPAAKAGLAAGDVITRIAGQEVTAAGDVIDLVSGRKIGDKVEVTYLRQGQRRTATVTLAEMPTTQLAQGEAPLGMSLQTLTGSIARSLGLDPSTEGAVVTEVRSGSPADRAGLAPGDVILEVDRQRVRTAEEATARLAADGGKPHLLRVRNAQGTRFVTVPPPG